MKKRLLSFAVFATIACASAFFAGATPKPVVKDVDMDKLMAKWEKSDNWVLVEHTTTDGMHDTTGYYLSNHLTVYERNGNITALTRSVKNSDHREYQQKHTHVFDGNHCKTYFGRKYEGRKEWDASPVRPNPGAGAISIEYDFKKWITWGVEPTMRSAATSMREISGVYHFWGIENFSEKWRQLGWNEGEGKPDVFQTFSYTLTFGSSAAKEPKIDADNIITF